MTAYQPPSHPLEVIAKLNFDDAIAPDDPRFVDTDAVRGGTSLPHRLARKFGLDLRRKDVFFPSGKQHALLFGPIGSGKSTELWRFARALETDGRVMPILMNVRGEIDINNLQYADMLMALAAAVVKKLDREGIALEPEKVQALATWFSEHVVSEEKVKELTGELRSEAGAALSIPFLAKLMTRLSAAFKTSSVYKDTLREIVKKTFTQFALAFNTLVLAAEDALRESGKAQRLLLIVDGTDKIPLADAERLFVFETEQLLAIQALILYTAPITLKYGGTSTSTSKLDTEEVLPIIKLQERDGRHFAPGWEAMRAILSRRIAPATFADPALMDRLIEFSGGHPRELLRLLRLACEIADERIDGPVVEKAIEKLAPGFRYWLKPEDYTLLAQVDASGGAHVGNDERTGNLLYRLALLHYNDGSWRSSHPAVRRLEGYQHALAELGKTNPAP